MGSQPEPATIVFTFDRPGMPVPHYTLTLREDGTGSYVAKAELRNPIEVGYQAEPRAGTPLQDVSMPVTVSAATTGAIFARAHELNWFNRVCASKRRVASTGAKTVSYTGAGGRGSCAYDYTEDKVLLELTNTFYGMANTLDTGRMLEADHRYDRLGLDKDMETLLASVKDGQSVEPGLIAATLKSIAEDTALIQRVRLRAAALLEQAEVR